MTDGKQRTGARKISYSMVTFLDALINALLHAGLYNKNDQVAPAAILWPDKERQWEPLLPMLREQLPLLTFGAYAPELRQGPAYYLRCMIAGSLPDDQLSDGGVPIVYMPGVSRQDLRDVEDCPRALQPLAELQYRGVFFSHKNGRDWTVAGFLQSSDGLDVSVATDNATREALQRALVKLAYEPVERLKAEAPLRAPFFDTLLNPDDVRRLLLWLNDPQGYPGQLTQEEWDAFCAVCETKYGFHPEKDGPITAASKLEASTAGWNLVWDRFEEAPTLYPYLPALLRKAQPKQPNFLEASPVWPQTNESAEEVLRDALRGIGELVAGDARNVLYALKGKHEKRRSWVWYQLGEAPLVGALEHLDTLAQVTEQPLGGSTVPAMADAYAKWGWKADSAVLDALKAVDKSNDVAAVSAAITALYRPWLEGATRAFQDMVTADRSKDYETTTFTEPAPGTCILFCDALRYDVGQRLVQALEAEQLTCHTQWGLAPLPTVTATAKPAMSPIADQFVGGDKQVLIPVTKSTGSSYNATLFRSLLESACYQVLQNNGPGDPHGRAWTEAGAIDQYGHEHGWKLAHHLDAELRALKERIIALLDHGWQRVVLVTDHGWQMLPGGLPKAELPQHLTTIRKGRYAVLKAGAVTEQKTVPWHWNSEQRIAIAPDICCFEAGKEYEHGGLSLQECVIPLITVMQSDGSASRAIAISRVIWKRLRCHIEITGAPAGFTVDIREKAGDAGTSLTTAPKAIEPDGLASLLVGDEDRDGDSAIIVVLDSEGTLHAQVSTIIGG